MAAAALIAAGGLLLALFPRKPTVMTGQAMIGVAGAVFLALAGVAALGLPFFWALMPETRAATGEAAPA